MFVLYKTNVCHNRQLSECIIICIFLEELLLNILLTIIDTYNSCKKILYIQRISLTKNH